MSRRKQAYPQQVQEKAAQEGPKNVVKQANRLAACDQTSPQTIVFQSLFDRQSRNVSLDSNNRPRRKKESKTENFAFFSVNALQIESMSEQNFNPSQVEAKRMQQGDVNTEEKTQKIAASPREHSDSETPFDPEKEVEQEQDEVDLTEAKTESSDKKTPPQESPSKSLQSVNEDDINQGTGGMTADNMTSWEKDTSEKLLASISSVNQSVENANKNYTNTNKEFCDVKLQNISYNSQNQENVMQQSTQSVRTSEDRMSSSPDSEKENLTAAKMIDILKMGKHQEDSSDEGKELDKIKDQVRMLQQQQMYQVQMLNYLQFQLNIMATNPQSQQKSPPGIFSSSGINGLQLQNMPQLLAAAATMSGSSLQGARPPTNSFFPSMAAAINQQLTSNKPGENPHQVFGAAQNLPNKKFELSTVNENIEQGNSESRNDSYNPLSSLAVLQNASQIRPTPEVLSNHLGDNVDTDDTYLKHVCRFCQKAFGSDSALQIHLRSHTGERPYKCNICANRFSTKGNLKVHFVRHKERYPHIEMNPNPVPEYLDNIATSTGIPYGMSVVPDVLDNKVMTIGTDNDNDASPSSQGKRSVELPIPYQCLDNGKKYDNSTITSLEQSLGSDQFKAGSEAEKTTSQSDLNAKQSRDAAALCSAAMASLPMNISSLMANGERQEQTSCAPLSVSPSVCDKMFRNVSSENESNDQNTVLHKPNTSSSETSKLQQLVEQIDRGKDLEKNECHICHRVLSCQSALKLHFRTHTGERPFKCDLCSRAFTTRGNLRTHYSSVHRQQLQNITSDHMGVRTNALQCPLCGSRFMDQQSFQQHMQMHIYMHQQQAIQLMNGQGPPVPPDYRGLGMINGAFPSNLALERQFSQNEGGSEQNNDNDDVFEESFSEKNATAKEDKPSKTTSPTEHDNSKKSATNIARFSYETNALPQSALANKITSQPPAFTFNAESKAKPYSTGGSDDAVLDLSRPSSNSSSTIADLKNSTPSSPLDGTANKPAHIPASTSINALTTMASQDPTLRLNGITSSNLSSSQDEARARKMTTACDICHKPFSCQSALEIHLRSHTKERPFICRVCQRGFTTKGNLKQHLLTHNITDVDDDMLEPVNSPLNGNSNSCSPPVSSMTQNTSLNQLKRQRDASPSAPPAKRTYPRHWCHICQKQFSSASSLQIHNRTHTGEKPFACSVCGRAFTTKGNLKVHMGTHVWGAGGSRRGRRISMDNPLISPWMQNTSNTNVSNPPLRPRAPPQIPAVPDQTALYQQYAAIASGLMGSKNAGDPRFQNNAVMNLNSAAAKLLMSNNLQGSAPVSAPSDDKPLEIPGKEEGNKSMAEIATEWIWNAYKKSQEQDVN